MTGDITFCTNTKCKYYKTCGRNLQHAPEPFFAYAHFTPDEQGNCKYRL